MSVFSKVAWQGEVSLLKAEWNDKDGHIVRLKLEDVDPSQSNPFKQFTKRRGDRAGTRFHGAIQLIGTQRQVYDGGLMLAGWSDTSTQGHTVTFWCEAPEAGQHLIHPFGGLTRGEARLAVVLVELDDTTDEPVDQSRRERVEKAHEGRARGTYPSNAAHMLATSEEFWQYLLEKYDVSVYSYDQATEMIKQILQIESRKELDSNPAKEEEFHQKIRRPYSFWYEKVRA